MSAAWLTATALVYLLWAAAMFQAAAAIRNGLRFRRYMRAAAGRPSSHGDQPPATIILPCCGLESRLAETVASLGAQNYPNYDVIFTFESADDPAYAAVGRMAAEWRGATWRRVVAGPTERRSQKVHNLLAAVRELRPECEVIAFVDSDAVPHADWLARLVDPLADPAVGAATGFRWYSAGGGFGEGVRSAWNAASVSFMHDSRYNFCWGGSTAIRRETFERCGVTRRWDGALSDDYQLTRALRDAGLEVRFVPQCLIPCEEPIGLTSFWRFARRQLVITRICAPHLWRAGLRLACLLVGGTTALFVLMIAAWTAGHARLAGVSMALWLLLLGLSRTKSALRQAGISAVLGPPAWTRRDWRFDVWGTEVLGVLHLFLLLSSVRARRIAWRHLTYEMISPDETRVIRPARDPLASAPPSAEPALPGREA